MAIGGAIGVVAARAVKMTAMPQMVALFNGVGGGAAALIALVGVPQARARSRATLDVERLDRDRALGADRQRSPSPAR